MKVCEMCGVPMIAERPIYHIEDEDQGLNTAAVCHLCYAHVQAYLNSLTEEQKAELRAQARAAERLERN